MFKKSIYKPNKLENIIYYVLCVLVLVSLVFLFGYALDKELENQEKFNIEQAKQYCSINKCNNKGV